MQAAWVGGRVRQGQRAGGRIIFRRYLFVNFDKRNRCTTIVLAQTISLASAKRVIVPELRLLPSTHAAYYTSGTAEAYDFYSRRNVDFYFLSNVVACEWELQMQLIE